MRSPGLRGENRTSEYVRSRDVASGVEIISNGHRSAGGATVASFYAQMMVGTDGVGRGKICHIAEDPGANCQPAGSKRYKGGEMVRMR
jgi:hypothetical protein